MSGLDGSSCRNGVRLAALACAVILTVLLASTTTPAAAGDHAQPAGSAHLDRLTGAG